MLYNINMEERDIELYKVFIEWKAKPQPEDSTIEEFCKKHKTTKTKILEFIDSPTYTQDLVAATILWAQARTPELMHTVYNQVKLSKSVNDLARFLEVIHEIKKKTENQTNTFNQFNFLNTVDDKRYEQIIRREARVLEEGSK